jgi:hypothetical protein
MSDLVARIRHANGLISVYDLIEYVGDHSRPRKIHCPVHDDKTKSAQVYPESNSLFCFTENRTYDPVGLVAEQEGLSIPAACDYIERNAGVRWERQEEDGDEFWRLARKAAASPDDVTFWTRRDVLLYRWAIHRTVLDLCGVDADWEAFDNAHLDTEELRRWRDEQLDKRLDTSTLGVN